MKLCTILFAFAMARAQTADSTYVGSKACFACHSSIYKSFQKTDMGRSMSLASEWKDGSLPSEATINQPDTAHAFSVSKTASGWQQGESEPGAFSVTHQLEYAVGTGVNGLTFLIRRGNFLFQAPLSYYSKARKWDLSPGYEHVDLGFSRMVPEQCINCHAGRPAIVKNTAGAYADPPFHELAIGCENCHGPGQRHVNSGGKANQSIVNPAKLTTTLADNICINCHQSGDARVTQPGKNYLDFRPGQWLFDTAVIFKRPTNPADRQSDLLQHYSAMQASRCFRESAGKLSCLSCHDPHTQPNPTEVATYYRPKCLTCHSDNSCRVPIAIRFAKTSSDDCVGCHMPKRAIAEISHSALTNHRIPALEGEPFPAIKQEESGGLVVVNAPQDAAQHITKPMLLRAYQQVTQKDAAYRERYLTLLNELAQTDAKDTFVQAALGDRALMDGNTAEAITHLKLALPLAEPAVYSELGQALAKLGSSEEAIEYLKQGLQLNPFDAVIRKTLILQYINLKSYSEARSLMQQYVADFPEDSLMRSLLQRVNK